MFVSTLSHVVVNGQQGSAGRRAAAGQPSITLPKQGGRRRGEEEETDGGGLTVFFSIYGGIHKCLTTSGSIFTRRQMKPAASGRHVDNGQSPTP